MKAKKAKSRMFQKKIFTSWDNFLKAIDQFLTDVGPDNLIEMVRMPAETGYQIIVWYWTDQPPTDEPAVVKV